MKRSKIASMALMVITTLLLIACTSSPGDEIDWGDVKTVQEMDCIEAPLIRGYIDTADKAEDGTPPKEGLKDWLSKQNFGSAEEAKKAIDTQCSPAPTTEPTPTNTTPPSSTADPTPSATTTSTPPETQKYYPINTITWGDVVRDPPTGLKEVIETSQATTGFTWQDVQEMAKIRAKGDNPEPDVRVIVVINNPALAANHQQARNEAGLSDKADQPDQTDIPVIGASRMETIGNRQLTGVQVILAPIERKADSDVGVAFIPFRYGLAFEGGNLIPVNIVEAKW